MLLTDQQGLSAIGRFQHSLACDWQGRCDFGLYDSDFAQTMSERSRALANAMTVTVSFCLLFLKQARGTSSARLRE